MKRFIAAALAAVMLLSVTACGGSGDPSSPAASGSSGGGAGTEAGYQDTFTIAVNNDQEIMDGQMNVSNDLVLPQVYSYLIKRDLDGNIVGDVAESWEVSEDELTWTFHLKKGVKFHSGKELTAADVKATYDPGARRPHGGFPDPAGQHPAEQGLHRQVRQGPGQGCGQRGRHRPLQAGGVEQGRGHAPGPPR